MKPLLFSLLATIALCSSCVAADNQSNFGDSSSTDDDSSETFMLHISATIDGSDELVFTGDRVRWIHKYWAPATDVLFNGKPWNNLDHSPASWGDIAQSLDLIKAHIVKRRGRDVIALELTQNGFDLYFCDSPNGADRYDVTIAIPRR